MFAAGLERADVAGSQIDPVAIGDLDGDGTDEFVYEESFHEGWYLSLLHWSRGAPKTRRLSGDS